MIVAGSYAALLWLAPPALLALVEWLVWCRRRAMLASSPEHPLRAARGRSMRSGVARSGSSGAGPGRAR